MRGDIGLKLPSKIGGDSVRIAIFANDSYFAFLLGRPVIEKYNSRINIGYLSTKNKKASKKSFTLLKKASIKYIMYRFAVEMYSKYQHTINKRSIESLLLRYNLPVYKTSNINQHMRSLNAVDIGITFNFDQILRYEFLQLFPLGVINCHASKLPFGKGISPALWTYARGAQVLWYSIYIMEAAIDTGKVLFQRSVPVFFGESAFSAYARLCHDAGASLAQVLKSIENGKTDIVCFSKENEGSYYGIPGKQHTELLRKSGRTLWKVKDFFADEARVD